MLAYEDMFDRLRLALRTGPEGDTWQGDSPPASSFPSGSATTPS